ncbi:MAG: hypothetical protein K6L76_03600 [Agarilytica sp.]
MKNGLDFSKIYLFGFGGRAKHDVLPVLCKLFDLSKIEIYASSSKKVNINGVMKKIKSIDEFSENDILQGTLVFMSIPTLYQESLLSRFSTVQNRIKHIFVDTPFISNVDFPNKITVMEDLPFSSLGKICEALDYSDVRGMIFYRCLYRYHGIALLRCFDEKIVESSENIFKILGTKISFLKSKLLRFVLISPRRYENGKIYLLTKKMNLRKLKMHVDIQSRKFYACNRVIDQYSEDEMSFLCDYSEKSGVISYIDDFKRIGLYRLIAKTLFSDGVAYACSQAKEDLEVGDRWLL